MKQNKRWLAVALLALVFALSAGCALAADSRVQWTVTQDTFQVQTTMTGVSVKAEGATAFRIYGQWEGDDPWDEPDEIGEDKIEPDGTYAMNWGWGKSGKINLWATALINGAWTGESAHITLTITAKGTIQAPVAVLEQQTAEIGHDVKVSFAAADTDAEVSGYYIEVYRVDANGDREEYAGNQRVSEAGEYWIDEGNFPSAGRYGIEVFPIADGYEIDTPDLTIITVTGTRPDAPEVELEKTTFMVGEEMYAYVTAENADRAHYQVSYNGGRSSGRSDLDENETRHEIWFGTSHVGDADLSVRVRVNGIWSNFSEPIRIRIESLGMLDTPDYKGIQEAYSTDDDIVITYAPVEHQESLDLRIYNSLDSWVMSNQDDDLTGSIVIPWGSLAAGHYRMDLVASGEGYQERVTRYSFDVVQGVKVWNYEPQWEGADSIRLIGYAGPDKDVVVPSEVDGYTVRELEEIFRKKGITSLVLPDTLEHIWSYTLYDIPTLQSVTIGKDTQVEEDAILHIWEYGGEPQPMDHFTVYGYTHSAAQIAAEKAGATFVPVGELTEGPTASTEETTVPLGKDIKITLDIDDSVEMVRASRSGSEGWTSEEWVSTEEDGTRTITVNFHELGEITLSFAAPEGDGWTGYGPALTFTVVLEGSLQPEIPETVMAYEPFIVRWQAVEGATSYILSGYNKDDGNDSFSISVEDIAELEVPRGTFKPGEYCFYIVAFGEDVYYRSYGYLTAEESDVGTLILPENLKEIQASAFEGTGAQVLEVPSSVETIGPRAFAQMDELLSVEMLGGNTQIDPTAFAGHGQMSFRATQDDYWQNYHVIVDEDTGILHITSGY